MALKVTVKADPSQSAQVLALRFGVCKDRVPI